MHTLGHIRSSGPPGMQAGLLTSVTGPPGWYPGLLVGVPARCRQAIVGRTNLRLWTARTSGADLNSDQDDRAELASREPFYSVPLYKRMGLEIVQRDRYAMWMLSEWK